MQYLHDAYNHANDDNDDGLEALVQTVAWNPEIEHILFQAHLRTPVNPNLISAPQLAPEQTVIPDIRFFSRVLDIEKDLIKDLKAKLACTEIPRRLERETKMNAYLIASLAEVAKPQRISD
jgi:hypothetical protein